MSREPALKLAISTVLPADLHVVSVRGREMLSQLSRVEVRVTSAPAGKDEFLPAALYKPARLTVLGSEHDSRSVLGMVTAVELEGTTREGRPVHGIRIEPQLWRLRQRRTSRIFQDLSVVQIAEQLLTEHNIPRRLRLSRQYPTRAYTAQHHQTDYAFLRRLLAEEGIFFYFDHPLALGTDVDLTGMGDSEVLVLCDTAQYYPPLAGGDRLYYRPEQAESALAGDSDQISRFTLELVDRPRQHDSPSEATAPRALARGRLAGLTPEGRVLVCWAGEAPRPAALATSCSHRALLDAIRAGRDVLLDFIGGDPAQPVVLGLLRDRLCLDDADPEGVSEPNLELRATERLVLCCGEASVELREDGRVTVRGCHIENCSTGAVKIKGASVAIN